MCYVTIPIHFHCIERSIRSHMRNKRQTHCSASYVRNMPRARQNRNKCLDQHRNCSQTEKDQKSKKLKRKVKVMRQVP